MTLLREFLRLSQSFYRGRPVMLSRPRTSIVVSFSIGDADPTSILIRSAVCSPIVKLYGFFFMYVMIASSKSSPATRTRLACCNVAK